MFFSLIICILAGVLAYSVWAFACLETNVHKARALDIPVVRIPVGGNNQAWVILQPLIWTIFDLLPFAWTSLPDFVRFTHRNWQFLERNHLTSRFGSVWALVSPAGISLHFSDPDDIKEIYTRWRDFVRPVYKYGKPYIVSFIFNSLIIVLLGMLAIYGPSVFTVELHDWPRHRKAIAAPFNEDLMEFVWNETLRYTTYVGPS